VTETVGCKSFPAFAGPVGEEPVNSYNRPYETVGWKSSPGVAGPVGEEPVNRYNRPYESKLGRVPADSTREGGGQM
jgi:hypothetical protein